MIAAARTWTFRVVLLSASLIIALPVVVDGAAFAGTLDKIREDGAIRIAYLPFSPPFSYKDDNSPEPSGFTVDLCRAVAKELAGQLGVPSLKPVYVLVSATNRFETMEKGNADLLCEATSVTLSRRRLVDFSIPIFVDGLSVMTNGAALVSLHSLAGQKVGVLGGATDERELRWLLDGLGTAAEIVPAKRHDEGLAMLEGGVTSAYFAERAILTFLLKNAQHPEKLHIAPRSDNLTVERYALALPHGDDDFRLAVDTALSHIFRSDEIVELYSRSFPGQIKQSGLMQPLYPISGLPD